jgi:hypothetical protein
MSEQPVTLAMDPPDSHVAQQAREDLAAALGAGGRVGPADPETGVFDVTVDADSREAALLQVWDLIAAAGVDDHILFLEHPDVPEHWKTKRV